MHAGRESWISSSTTPTTVIITIISDPLVADGNVSLAWHSPSLATPQQGTQTAIRRWCSYSFFGVKSSPRGPVPDSNCSGSAELLRVPRKHVCDNDGLPFCGICLPKCWLAWTSIPTRATTMRSRATSIASMEKSRRPALSACLNLAPPKMWVKPCVQTHIATPLLDDQLTSSSIFTCTRAVCSPPSNFSCLITPSSNSTLTLPSGPFTTVVFCVTLLFHPLISALHSPVPAKSHSPHFLPTGKQTVWPSPTSILLISCHLSLGSQASRQALVSSGVFVLCQPHRLVMRCTCTSTPMPSSRPQAADMHRYAIFGPTPGRLTSPSIVSGISELNRSFRMSAACLMYLVLLLWKPTLPIKLSKCLGSQAMILSIVNCDCFISVSPSSGLISSVDTSSVCKRCIATAVTVSLVCEDSINDVNVWYRLSRGGAVGQNSSSQPMVSTGAVGLRCRIALTIS
ncbi:hypothetical protein HRR85_006251 [Exophiala dermatitidis]|nr:hypothetical protein HRR85_006251 [Exophiala dermatitidis]